MRVLFYANTCDGRKRPQPVMKSGARLRPDAVSTTLLLMSFAPTTLPDLMDWRFFGPHPYRYHFDPHAHALGMLEWRRD